MADIASVAALEPPRAAVVAVVRAALDEDLTPLGDLTSALLPPVRAQAAFVPRADGVLAGRAAVVETFRRVDPEVAVTWSATDGDRVAAGRAFAVAEGPLASILTAERTALNFCSHLSGVATRTATFVAETAGTSCRIWDTRKTTPGLRALEKAAVRAGGGANHRGNLSDWVLLKDNHLAVLGIAEAVAAARARWPARTVHVECDTFDQLTEALDAGADAVLLDNMSPEQVTSCVAEVERRQAAGGPSRRVLVEVSGGVSLDRVAAYAATGVDCISVGSLTNGAPVLDIGLDITEDPREGPCC